MAALLWLLRRKMRRAGRGGSRGALIRSLAATAAMAAALRLWLSMLAGPWDRALIAALGGIFLAAAVYLAAARCCCARNCAPPCVLSQHGEDIIGRDWAIARASCKRGASVAR